MANILKKFTKIMNANVNSILDKMENPEKMMNQYITDMEEDIADVKMQTAGVMRIVFRSWNQKYQATRT